VHGDAEFLGGLAVGSSKGVGSGGFSGKLLTVGLVRVVPVLLFVILLAVLKDADEVFLFLVYLHLLL
jgi:hypothetical protein